MGLPVYYADCSMNNGCFMTVLVHSFKFQSFHRLVTAKNWRLIIVSIIFLKQFLSIFYFQKVNWLQLVLLLVVNFERNDISAKTRLFTVRIIHIWKKLEWLECEFWMPWSRPPANFPSTFSFIFFLFLASKMRLRKK